VTVLDDGCLLILEHQLEHVDSNILEETIHYDGIPTGMYQVQEAVMTLLLV
jgi:hypothetical protein